MFDFLKTKQKKLAETLSDGLMPAFDELKRVNRGQYPDDIFEDDFIIGYLSGVYSAGFRLAGILDRIGNYPVGLALFLEKIFPRKALYMYTASQQKVETSSIAAAAFKKGSDEYEDIMFSVQLAGRIPDEVLPALFEYLVVRYGINQEHIPLFYNHLLGFLYKK